MREIEVTLRIPAALIERAQAAGVKIEARTEQFINELEAEIERAEAVKHMFAVMDQWNTLPAAERPAHEELDEAIRAGQAALLASPDREAKQRAAFEMMDQLQALEPQLTPDEINEIVDEARQSRP